MKYGFSTISFFQFRKFENLNLKNDCVKIIYKKKKEILTKTDMYLVYT